MDDGGGWGYGWVCASVLCIAMPGAVGSASAQSREIAGVVRTAQDSMPVVGVVVQASGTRQSTATERDGSFSLTGLPLQDHDLIFSRLGVLTDTVHVPLGIDSIDVSLVSDAVPLAGLVVVSSAETIARERFAESAQASAVGIDREVVQSTPAFLEADVLRTIQLLPGTIAVNDYTVGYHARGGEADQNLIQLDGVTIFNPSHLGGLFSTFDAQAIGNTEYLTGGFPSNYSGRLSSVLDVRTRSGSPEFGVMGQVSLLSSKVLLEGSLPLENSTFLVAGRRTYADKVVSALSTNEFPYYFGDAVAKLTFPLSGGGSLTVTGYVGRDALDYEPDPISPEADPVSLRVDWGNRLLGISYEESIFGKPAKLSASVTEFSTKVGLFPDFARISNDVRLFAANAEWSLVSGRAHDLRLGAGVEDYRMDYDIRSDALDAVFLDQEYHPLVGSVFVDDLWRPSDRWMIRPGVRVEAVGGGAGVVAVSPRVSVKAFLNPDFALTGSAGRYHQAIHSRRDHNSPWSFVDFWVGADSVTPVGRSEHLVLGFERWFAPNLSLTVEGYRKTFDDILNANPQDDFAVAGDEFVPVTGDAHGLDVLLRRYSGTWSGWLSYTFAKAKRRDPTQEYAPAHDRRHYFNIVVNGPGVLGSTLSARFGYGSPLPYTQTIGQWEHRSYNVAGNGFFESIREYIADPQLNTRRYPSYSRLDVSFRWKGGMWGGEARPFLQFVNLANHKNVFLYVDNLTRTPPTRETIPQLPLLMSFGMEFVF